MRRDPRHDPVLRVRAGLRAFPHPIKYVAITRDLIEYEQPIDVLLLSVTHRFDGYRLTVMDHGLNGYAFGVM